MSQKTDANARQRPARVDRTQTCARCTDPFSTIARPVRVFNGQFYLTVHRACMVHTDQEVQPDQR